MTVEDGADPTTTRPPVSRDSKRILAALALLTLVIRIPLLGAPIFRDEGMYGYTAQEVLRGYLPWETAVDNKGPLLIYEYALGLAIGGMSSIEGIRAVGLAFALGSGLALFALARDMRGEKFALIATSLYVVHSNLVALYGHFCGSEVFTLTPVLLAMWQGWRAPRAPSAWPSFFCGLFFGLAVWTRLTVVTWGVSVGIFLLWRACGMAKLWRALAMIAGAGLVSAFFLILYGWNNKLGVFVDGLVTFPKVQLATSEAFITEREQIMTVLGIALPQTVSIWLPCLFVLVHPRRLNLEARVFLLPWLAMALMGFYATHLYLVQQLFLVYPAAYLLAAWQLQDWGLADGSRLRSKNAAVWLVAACLLFNLATNARLFVGLASRDLSVSDPQLIQGAKVGRWVRDNTPTDSFFYQWGVEWETYFVAERRSPTRQLNALLMVMFGVAVENGAPMAAEFDRIQKEIIAGLEAHPPEIVAVTASVKNYDMKSFYLPAYVDNMLRTKYDLLFEEKPYWIFRRKGSTQQSVP